MESAPPPPSEEDINSALESFRDQWRAEVRARRPADAAADGEAAKSHTTQTQGQIITRPEGWGAAPGQSYRSHRSHHSPLQQRRRPSVPHVDGGNSGGGDGDGDGDDEDEKNDEEDDDNAGLGTGAPPPVFSEPPEGTGGAGLGPQVRADHGVAKLEHDKAQPHPRPSSAMDYFEAAMEKEAQGSLGDSLRLYRTAFRMDSKVDQHYRAKHFPSSSLRPQQATTVAVPVPVPVPVPVLVPVLVPAPPAPDAALADHPGPPKIDHLIGSFANFSIQPAPPEIEGTIPPPCPIALLPDEVLLHIMVDVATDDVGGFVRLAQVCKRLAYLVATEDHIWRRVCLGSEFGFGGMHYSWNRTITWGQTGDEEDEEDDNDDDLFRPPHDTGPAVGQRRLQDDDEARAMTHVLLRTTYDSSWHIMFRFRPRIRFNGCYISTVNYIRSGQASANQVTWNSPVHICTYFRYLRFFRDGTCISLLTTEEPVNVVHHMTKELLELHMNGAMVHLPSSVMQNGLRGRWRLSSLVSAVSSTSSAVSTSSNTAEGDLFVETEGVGKYMYSMELALRSTGKGARNNKLVWKGFYSYNRLTDDWAAFTLKNVKAFIFSRVKRYSG